MEWNPELKLPVQTTATPEQLLDWAEVAAFVAANQRGDAQDNPQGSV